MFTAKISVDNRKAFEGLKGHLEYLCRLNGATIIYEDYSKEEKEKKIAILFKKFNRRIHSTNYSVEDFCFGESDSFVLLWRNDKPYAGYCKRAPSDKYDQRIARMLCYSRAFGWKDIEQELLDILG